MQLFVANIAPVSSHEPSFLPACCSIANSTSWWRALRRRSNRFRSARPEDLQSFGAPASLPACPCPFPRWRGTWRPKRSLRGRSRPGHPVLSAAGEGCRCRSSCARQGRSGCLHWILRTRGPASFGLRATGTNPFCARFYCPYVLPLAGCRWAPFPWLWCANDFPCLPFVCVSPGRLRPALLPAGLYIAFPRRSICRLIFFPFSPAASLPPCPLGFLRSGPGIVDFLPLWVGSCCLISFAGLSPRPPGSGIWARTLAAFMLAFFFSFFVVLFFLAENEFPFQTHPRTGPGEKERLGAGTWKKAKQRKGRIRPPRTQRRR